MIEIPKHLLDSKRPFFVCSRSILERQVSELEGLGAEVFYSVKTNPERAILKVLHELGTGFSVSNPEEFMLALSVGAAPEKILYYERGFTEAKVKWLIRMGCINFAVDSKAALANLLPHIGASNTVLLRVKAAWVNNSYGGGYTPGLDRGEIKSLLPKCKCNTGVLHHAASQIEEVSAWRSKFKELSELPADMDVVNIGGGLPISYGNGEYSDVLAEIRKGIKKLRADRIIIEPGRFIVGPACSLVAKVELVDGENAVLNCSVYNTHIDTIIANLSLPCRTLKKGHPKEYRLLGSSLCNLDIFDQKARLPKLSPGDSIVFDSAGAYNFSSDFGSGLRLETYIID